MQLLLWLKFVSGEVAPSSDEPQHERLWLALLRYVLTEFAIAGFLFWKAIESAFHCRFL